MNKILQSKNYKLDLYIQNLKNVPILSKDEEYIFFKNFKEKNDINSAKKLVEANLNYVIKIAKNYQNYGIVIKDLIQVGVIGLMKAVKNFDPNKKVRLISFAIYWIKSEIHEYIIRNLKIVKTTKTKNQRKLFFNLKSFKKNKFLNKNEQIVISNLLNVKKKDIEYMELNLYKNDISLYTKDNKTDNYQLNLINFYEKNDPLFLIEKREWINYIKKHFYDVYNKLDNRSKKIIFFRFLSKKKYTLKYLAKMYNISSERVRQLEKNVLIKLKKKINIEK